MSRLHTQICVAGLGTAVSCCSSLYASQQQHRYLEPLPLTPEQMDTNSVPEHMKHQSLSVGLYNLHGHNNVHMSFLGGKLSCYVAPVQGLFWCLLQNRAVLQGTVLRGVVLCITAHSV